MERTTPITSFFTWESGRASILSAKSPYIKYFQRSFLTGQGRLSDEIDKLTVIVTKTIPDPGKKFGWSKLCQTGYRPRSESA
jgi:hypothetical protein